MWNLGKIHNIASNYSLSSYSICFVELNNRYLPLLRNRGLSYPARCLVAIHSKRRFAAFKWRRRVGVDFHLCCVHVLFPTVTSKGNQNVPLWLLLSPFMLKKNFKKVRTNMCPSTWTAINSNTMFHIHLICELKFITITRTLTSVDMFMQLWRQVGNSGLTIIPIILTSHERSIFNGSHFVKK